MLHQKSWHYIQDSARKYEMNISEVIPTANMLIVSKTQKEFGTAVIADHSQARYREGTQQN